MWQDYLLSIGAVLLSVSMIPMLRDKTKPPYLTSIPSAIIMTVFVYINTTLDLWVLAVVNGVIALLWYWLVWQRRQLKTT